MPSASLHMSGQTQYCKQVFVKQAMECCNMGMSSTVHTHIDTRAVKTSSAGKESD